MVLLTAAFLDNGGFGATSTPSRLSAQTVE
jgi:hypothetical protein